MAEQDTLDALEDIPTSDLTALRAALMELRVHEVVALLGRSDSRRRAVLFRLLPKDRALAVFEALDSGLAREVLGGLRDERSWATRSAALDAE